MDDRKKNCFKFGFLTLIMVYRDEALVCLAMTVAYRFLPFSPTAIKRYQVCLVDRTSAIDLL
jgi:hypothetical protein